MVEPIYTLSGDILNVLFHSRTAMEPEAAMLSLTSDQDSKYIELSRRMIPDGESKQEYLSRIPIRDLSVEQWNALTEEFARFKMQAMAENGLEDLAEKITNDSNRFAIYTLLSFCSLSQFRITMELHRRAAETKSGSRLSFKTNDVLESLGYSRSSDGHFPAKFRAQFHRNLMALHSTEVLIMQHTSTRRRRAKLSYRSILRIRDVDLDNLPREFDMRRAAEDGYGCADGYIVDLEFFDLSPGNSVCVSDVDIRNHQHKHDKDDYELSAILLLAHAQVNSDGSNLIKISMGELLEFLKIQDSNTSRRKTKVLRTLRRLKESGHIQEFVQDNSGNIEIAINPEKIRS
jgi:hypothetical protein